MITTLAVHGYRSLRDLAVPMAPVTLVTGANGSGKSSLYRAMRLLAGGQLELEPLLTHRHSLDDWQDALDGVRTGSGVKHVICPHDKELAR